MGYVRWRYTFRIWYLVYTTNAKWVFCRRLCEIIELLLRRAGTRPSLARKKHRRRLRFFFSVALAGTTVRRNPNPPYYTRSCHKINKNGCRCHHCTWGKIPEKCDDSGQASAGGRNATRKNTFLLPVLFCCRCLCIGAFETSAKSRQQWLRESETIVNIEHSLLFCAPPNTGSLQFRMLAKRMEVRFLLVWN